MAITTRRMAELVRATLRVASLTSDQFVVQSDIIKINGSKLSLTVRRAKDPAVSPIRWFTHWWMFRSKEVRMDKFSCECIDHAFILDTGAPESIILVIKAALCS
ncbi:MAG: hypothetical protein EZS28_047962, partial [Streblomastix strix]